MKILVADDEPVSRLRLEVQLESWDYKVVVARDGVEAWDLLQGEAAPLLAILDWMMPGLDGTDVCRRVRAHGNEPYTYLLLLTGRDRKQDLIEGLEARHRRLPGQAVRCPGARGPDPGGRRIVSLHEELVSAREAMRFQATHDALTGVWNRFAMADALEREMSRARRQQVSVAIITADLDHFKSVNDRYGHPGGDVALRETMQRLRSCIRPFDLIARYGGEELVIALVGCDAAPAMAVADRMRACVAGHPILFGERAMRITASFGVACAATGYHVQDLIRRADEALYRAKQGRRDRVELAPP